MGSTVEIDISTINGRSYINANYWLREVRLR